MMNFLPEKKVNKTFFGYKLTQTDHFESEQFYSNCETGWQAPKLEMISFIRKSICNYKLKSDFKLSCEIKTKNTCV